MQQDGGLQEKKRKRKKQISFEGSEEKVKKANKSRNRFSLLAQL